MNREKNPSVIGVLMVTAFILLLLLVERSFAQDNMQASLSAETAITAQLSSELSSILPAKSFAVFTSVGLHSSQVRELLEGESVQVRRAEPPKSNEDLPGFEEGLKETEPEPAGKERQTYRMVNRTEIDRVNVTVVTDQRLPAAIVTTAKALLTQRLTASFGTKATAIFQQANLMGDQKMPAQSGMGSFNDDAGKDTSGLFLGLTKSELLKWLLITVGLVGLTLLIRRLMMGRQMPRKDMGRSPAPPTIDMYANPFSERQPFRPAFPLLPQSEGTSSTSDPGLSSATLPPPKPAALPAAPALPSQSPDFSSATEEFIETIASEPMTARSFLAQLNPDSRRLLNICFKASALRTAFDSLMGPVVDEAVVKTKDEDDRDTLETKAAKLRALTAELQQFRKLMHLQKQQRFGFLSMMTATEVLHLLDGEPTEIVSVVLTHLPRSLATGVLRAMPEGQKQVMMTRLSRKLNIPPFSPEEITTFELNLRAKAEQMSTNVFVPRMAQDTLADLILESSDDPAEVINQLGDIDPELRQKYRHYTITMDDFLNESPERKAWCLETVSNEIVALALSGFPDDKRTELFGTLSDSRRRVVSSLTLAMARGSSQRDIENAKQSILASYKQAVLKTNYSGANNSGANNSGANNSAANNSGANNSGANNSGAARL